MGVWSLVALHHSLLQQELVLVPQLRSLWHSRPVLFPTSRLQYSYVADFLEDMNTLFRNAQLFNEETSLVHHDSITLSCLTCHTLKELWKERAPSTGEELDELLAIMTSARVSRWCCVCVRASMRACVCVSTPL